MLLLQAGIPTLYGQTAQPGAPPTLTNTPQQRDTTTRKTNTNKWSSNDVQIHTTQAWSQQKKYPDSSVHTFHRRPFIQPWHRDLGNLGSPVRNLLFSPREQIGLSLGYDIFDVYRFRTDSILYYNTTRPYSEFIFRLGSKAEQMAQILHTQNIQPNWNVAVQYRKLTSPGFYKIQRNNHDNMAASTHYQSRNQRYTLFGAIAYNKLQHDANGGLIADSLLNDERFGDRQTIPVGFDNDAYSIRRSSVTNMHRDLSVLVQQRYTRGPVDTLYSEDSTQFSTHLTPRFSISHRLGFSSEKFQYKDMRPDSLRYAPLFQATIIASDSIQMDQIWHRADNRLMLDGFLGPEDRQLQFSAGFGNRYDQFTTAYVSDADKRNVFSNYLIGSIGKEALEQGQWFYQADAQLYITGQPAGDFVLSANLGKSLKRIGELSVGFRQQLSEAPYNYTLYQNQYARIENSLSKQSTTLLYGQFHSERLKLSGGVRNYVMGNYIYLGGNQLPAQHADVFNLTQAWARKAFHLGVFVLDNEIVFQQTTANAPVNIPQLMGRHQLSIESRLFRNALQMATGLEVRYHTPYYADGYSPFMGRYYYQTAYEINNKPEGSVFFNFRIKRLRAYIMIDQLQQFFYTNNIAAPGYPVQNAMLRFGFNWVMIN